MNIMTKRGQLDNIVVYEHYCDTTADLANIPSQYTTLGSIALVIHDDNANGLEVYMATTEKEWVPILNGGSDNGNIVDVHICTSDEYDAETGEPTIENPIEGQFYLVPSASGSTSDMFDEWFYTNGAWEKFGSAGTAVDVPQSDWNQNDENAVDYVKNRTHWEESMEDVFYTNNEVTFINGLATINEYINYSGNNVFCYNGRNRISPYSLIIDNVPYRVYVSPNFPDSFPIPSYCQCGFYTSLPSGADDFSVDAAIYFQWYAQSETPSASSFRIWNKAYENIASITVPVRCAYVNSNVHKLDAKYLYQADWSQEDANAADYVKNRTHYDLPGFILWKQASMDFTYDSSANNYFHNFTLNDKDDLGHTVYFSFTPYYSYYIQIGSIIESATVQFGSQITISSNNCQVYLNSDANGIYIEKIIVTNLSSNPISRELKIKSFTYQFMPISASNIQTFTVYNDRNYISGISNFGFINVIDFLEEPLYQIIFVNNNDSQYYSFTFKLLKRTNNNNTEYWFVPQYYPSDATLPPSAPPYIVYNYYYPKQVNYILPLDSIGPQDTGTQQISINQILWTVFQADAKSLDEKYLPLQIADWLASSESHGYINNKPNIIKASGTNAIVMNDVQNNSATGLYSVAEGSFTAVSGTFSHAEGYKVVVSGDDAHAEGYNTSASGFCAHAEGNNTKATADASHAEGMLTQANSKASHAEGYGTKTNSPYQHAFGKYNSVSTAYIEMVGNGSSESARKNIRTLDWNGNETLAGALTLGKGTTNETTITAAQLKALLNLARASGVSF